MKSGVVFPQACTSCYLESVCLTIFWVWPIFFLYLLSGIEKKKGTMDYGSDADLIIVDHDMTLHSTYVAGQCVYQRDIHIER